MAPLDMPVLWVGVLAWWRLCQINHHSPVGHARAVDVCVGMVETTSAQVW